jgi:hypothetical protein
MGGHDSSWKCRDGLELGLPCILGKWLSGYWSMGARIAGSDPKAEEICMNAVAFG